MGLALLMALLYYIAFVVLVAGVATRIAQYARTPAPMKIPTTPAPTTRTGVVARMAGEVVLFRSLFRSNKWLWLFGWMFHLGLLLVLLRHLRYIVEPAPVWLVWLQPAGKYAAFAMVAGLVGLWLRRVLLERIRFISSPSDHLMLALIVAIGITGVLTTYVWNTDVVAMKAFLLGLIRFDLQPLPADPLIIGHLVLVALLMLVFPVSKLLHAPGIFFSPTRNQVDDPRERRHVNPWSPDPVVPDSVAAKQSADD